MSKQKTAKDFKLTEKQFEYCKQYVLTNNQHESYRRAYNGRHGKDATQVHSLPKVQACISELMQEAVDKCYDIMKPEEILSILSQIARGEVTEERLTVRGVVIEVKTDLKSRIKALELLAKKYALLTEKVQAEVQVEQVVFVDDFEEVQNGDC